MRNFAKLQKAAKAQKNAFLIKIHNYCIFIHCGRGREDSGVTRPLQRDVFCHSTDFKGFLIRYKRDATASAGSVTQPPHPL